MNKPREFYTTDEFHYEVQYNSKRCIEIPRGEKINGNGIHLIEKSAADKLAKALEFIEENNSYIDDMGNHVARQALKEYRGENEKD
jgi:hypothetical protein